MSARLVRSKQGFSHERAGEIDVGANSFQRTVALEEPGLEGGFVVAEVVEEQERGRLGEGHDKQESAKSRHQNHSWTLAHSSPSVFDGTREPFGGGTKPHLL